MLLVTSDRFPLWHKNLCGWRLPLLLCYCCRWCIA